MKAKISRLNPKETVLLVIDMQNDFIEKGKKLEVRGIRDGISKLKAFIDYCRGKGVLIIYTRHYYTKSGNPISTLLFSNLSDRGLNRNAKGFEIHKDLGPEKRDLLIDKKRYDAFFKTGLNEILKSRRTRNIIITGTMTQVCCESTARSAMFLDYVTVFCSDLTFSGDEIVQKAVLKTFNKYFGWVFSSNKARRLLK